jgi:hypothetical protein
MRKVIVPLVVLLPLATGCVRQTTREFAAADPSADEPAAEPHETRSLELAYDDANEGASEPVVAPRAPPAPRPIDFEGTFARPPPSSNGSR